jgi:hypothetical protein
MARDTAPIFIVTERTAICCWYPDFPSSATVFRVIPPPSGKFYIN